MGCWTDTSDRAIKGQKTDFSDNPIEKCHTLAAGRGYNYFAVQARTECFTADNAGKTYKTYGRSNKCDRKGVGGTWAQDVYKIVPCLTGISKLKLDLI